MTFAQYSPVFNLSVSSTRNAVKNYGFDSPQKEFIQLPEIFVSTAISNSALAIQKYLPDMIARMNQWVISTGRFSEVNPEEIVVLMPPNKQYMVNLEVTYLGHANPLIFIADTDIELSGE